MSLRIRDIIMSLRIKMHINAQYKMMQQIGNWKQVEIISWKEQRDIGGRKKISEEKMREVEKLDNEKIYK